jgi:type IV pilus assembly protein PilE
VQAGLTRLPLSGQRGFTLVECAVACAVVGLTATLALPAYRSHELRAGRLDAVDSITRIQVAQEQHRAAHGLYAQDLSALLGVGSTSRQGRYALRLTHSDAESYAVVATAQGAQLKDSACATLTLQVVRGFPQEGPSASCWNR